MRWIAIVVCSAALAGNSALAQAQNAPAKTPAPQGATHLMLPPVPKALLPDSFAGWVSDAAPKKVTDAAQADPANAAALKEYDFTDAALATYKRSGETLSLHALRFHDASGAYGAYSFYRQSGWPKEEIGTGATSNHNRVLFWLGNTVVDANFSRIGAMSGSELRELAAEVPVPDGSRALAPPILSNLPKTSLDGQTTHYAVGPVGYVGAGGVLPPELVGFNLGAEAVTANYSLRSGPTIPRRRWPLRKRRRFATTSRPAARPRRPGPSRWQTPTMRHWKCAAAGRWWPWSAATPSRKRATSCWPRCITRPT
jgi:hypothetical protein